ncbi:MAG: 50S ribosomal protein L25/general stress protein Ctc [Gammaproteobacteria bacterium]|nr:50S ribosomal protein L25/general stress protein Ctc [Gammaproteobacteria bacterium]
MSDLFELNAEIRTDMGKGASRRLRRTNLVPAIVYGVGKEPTAITLKANELTKKLESEAFYSQVLSLQIGKKKENVILRDLQRHPFKAVILHADFLRIDDKKAIQVHLPLHIINDEIAHGVKMEGGVINRVLMEVEISCLPKDLPEFIEVDVAELKLGESIHLTELVIPEGVEIVALAHGADHDTAVVSIHKPKEVTEDEPVVDAAAADAGAEDAASDGDASE